MSNKWWREPPAKSPPKQKPGKDRGNVVEKTMNWPGVPGKTGKDRSAGVKRVKGHAVSVGI